MSQVRVTESSLENIADAIRAKLGVQTTYRPSEMAAAIQSIPTGSSAVLEHLSVTENGTYTPGAGVDGFDQVTVNVSGGGGDILTGRDVPSASLGSDGDVYKQVIPIPNNVIFVDYLQSSGTQYIDTGIIVTAGLGMFSKGIFRGVSQWSFGTRNESTITYATVALVSSASGTTSKYCLKSFGTAHDFVSYSVQNNGRYEETIKIVDFAGDKYALQGGKSETGSNGMSTKMGTQTGSYSIVLFGVNTSGTITKSSNIALCRVVFFDGIVPIADYLPCLDGNGVACMWDNIAQEYVYNDGTGDFSYGSSVTPTELDPVYWQKINGTWEVIRQ